jgi:hypothetical protein
MTEPITAPTSKPEVAVESPPTTTGVRRPWLVVALCVLGGFLLTVAWSAAFVDDTIGQNVASTLLGHDAETTPIGGIVSGVVFAFVSGMAGTFTACNIAALGTVAPLVGSRPSVGARLREIVRPLGWLALGMFAVAGAYGFVVALVGTDLPQFEESAPGGGLSPRLVQAMVVFGIIGVSFTYLGLAALGLVRDPLARVSVRFPGARMLVMGALIGGFLIGRPFPLFHMLFQDAAESHNPFYGAVAFMLQSAGNIVLVSILFVILALAMGGGVHRWLVERPGRAAVVTGSALLVSGVFTILYWDVRLLSFFDIIWYPTAPWT